MVIKILEIDRVPLNLEYQDEAANMGTLQMLFWGFEVLEVINL
jgi:hypothetical protein